MSWSDMVVRRRKGGESVLRHFESDCQWLTVTLRDSDALRLHCVAVLRWPKTTKAKQTQAARRSREFLRSRDFHS